MCIAKTRRLVRTAVAALPPWASALPPWAPRSPATRTPSRPTRSSPQQPLARRHEQSSPTAGSVWCAHRRTVGSPTGSPPPPSSRTSPLSCRTTPCIRYSPRAASTSRGAPRTGARAPSRARGSELRTSHSFTVLSTLPVAMTQSLYLFQSQLRISYSCAGMVSVECGCRTSQIFRVQSPDAVANTSACCGTTRAAYTQYACSANVRSDPGAFGFVADGEGLIQGPQLDGVVPGGGQEHVLPHLVPVHRVHLVRVLLERSKRVGHRGAFTSHTLTDPSPDADTRTFSFASLQQQSYSPSAVSNRATSTSAPFGAASSTYCCPCRDAEFWEVA